MNFIGKTSGGGGGDSGSSTGSRRQQQQQQQQQEEEDEEERQNTGGPTGQLFPSSSSSSPSSSHHPHQHQHQPSSFHPQPPYHHQNPRGGWMFDGHGGGEPSTRISDHPMMVDYASVPVVTPAGDTNDDENQQGGGGERGGMMMVVEREHMFDKVVTPSDVGKLNRLVIPKQHAERYFPLDSSTNDKGLLLNFEDRNGKPWRFRYSYWNSSQSYVMTKGWSRFVKDKKLDAGDIVSFQRGVGGSAKDRLFIDWRHRPDAPAPPYQLSSNLSFPLPHHQYSFHSNRNIHPWNPLFLQSQPAAAPSRSHSNNLMLQPPNIYRYGNTVGGGGPYHNIGTGSVVNVNHGGSGSGSGSVIYFRSGVGSGGGGIPQHQQMDMMQMHHQRISPGIGIGIGMDPPPAAAALPPPTAPQSQVFESVPVVHGKAAAKRLRLFGVNMDCPISDEDDQDYDPFSSSDHQLSPTMASAATTNMSMGNYHHGQIPPHHHYHPPTPSSSTIPYLQLRPYGGSETHETPMVSSSSNDALNKPNKSSSSHMSLDLDI